MNNESWEKIVYKSLINLNGCSKLEQIYDECMKIAPQKCQNNPTYKNTIRRTLQDHCGDSTHYSSKKSNLFIAINGLGKGIYGIREFIEDKIYQDKESLNKLKEYKDKLDNIDLREQVSKVYNYAKETITKDARYQFREKALSWRNIGKNDSYTDLSTNEGDISTNMLFNQACHIIDVFLITNSIIKSKINHNLNIDKFIQILQDHKNSLILPFNYHKLFDMNIIWFNQKGCLEFNIEFENDLKEFGIKKCWLKEEIIMNKNIQGYIRIRLEYRKNQFIALNDNLVFLEFNTI